MKIAIIYYSKTGNTKKLSQIAYEILKEKNQVEIIPLEKVKIENLDWDLIFLGSYCDSNSYPKKVKEFLNNIRGNIKKIASFVTHATGNTGQYYERWAKGCEDYFYNYCNKNNIENYGYYHCQAKPSLPISIFIKNAVFKEKQDWEDYKKDMNNHPDKEEIDSFKEFISQISLK